MFVKLFLHLTVWGCIAIKELLVNDVYILQLKKQNATNIARTSVIHRVTYLHDMHLFIHIFLNGWQEFTVREHEWPVTSHIELSQCLDNWLIPIVSLFTPHFFILWAQLHQLWTSTHQYIIGEKERQRHCKCFRALLVVFTTRGSYEEWLYLTALFFKVK